MFQLSETLFPLTAPPVPPLNKLGPMVRNTTPLLHEPPQREPPFRSIAALLTVALLDLLQLQARAHR